MYYHTAYLIVICDPVTNAVLSSAIWSSPEWEQSRRLEQRTYVLYAVKETSYHEAREELLKQLREYSGTKERYGWALEHLDKD